MANDLDISMVINETGGDKARADLEALVRGTDQLASANTRLSKVSADPALTSAYAQLKTAQTNVLNTGFTAFKGTGGSSEEIAAYESAMKQREAAQNTFDTARIASEQAVTASAVEGEAERTAAARASVAERIADERRVVAVSQAGAAERASAEKTVAIAARVAATEKLAASRQVQTDALTVRGVANNPDTTQALIAANKTVAADEITLAKAVAAEQVAGDKAAIASSKAAASAAVADQKTIAAEVARTAAAKVASPVSKSGAYFVTDETRAQELLAAKTAPIATLYDQELKTKQAILTTTDAQSTAELRQHAAALQSERLARMELESRQRMANLSGVGGTGGGAGKPPITGWEVFPSGGGSSGPGGPGGWGAGGDPYASATGEIKVMEEAATKATSSMSKGLKGVSGDARDFGIIVRSAGSIVAPQYAGYLYYFSQIERNLKGDALAAGVASIAIASVVASVGALIVAGAKIDGINQSFDNMTKSAGISGDELLQAMQKASMGTLSVADSMKMANIAMMSVGTSMAADLPRLLEIARASSVATGQDINYTFQSLITGIARGSPKLIDNANIYLKLGDANATYAASLGKSVSELSAQEKQVATLNAVLAAGGDLNVRIGVTSATANEKIATLGVAFTDLTNSVGLYLATTGISVPGYIAGIAKNIDMQLANVVIQEQITAEQRKAADQDAAIADKRKTIAASGLTAYDTEAARVRAYRDELLKTNDANKASLSWQGAVPRTQAGVIALQQQYNAVYGDTVKGYAAAYDAQQKLLGLPTTAELTAQAAAAAKLVVPLSAAGQAFQAYFEAMVAVQTSPAQNFGADLAKDVTKLRDLIGNFPKMPSIGASSLTTDIDQLKIWAPIAEAYIAQRYEMRNLPEAAVASVFPSKDRPTNVVNDLEKAQQALADSLAIVTVGNKTFIVSNESMVGSIADTVKSWDTYGAVIQKTLIQLGIVPLMLADIQKTRNLPITPTDLSSGTTDALKALDSLAEKYDKVGLARQASEIRGPVADSLIADIQANWQSLLTLDAAGWATWIAQRTQGLDDLVTLTVDKRQKLLDAQKDIVTLQTDVLARPKLGETPMTTDLAGLDAYYAALGKLDPANSDLTLSIQGDIAALIQQRTESLATALAMDNPLEAIRQLAAANMGYGTSVVDFIKKIALIPGAVGSSVNAVKLLGLAVEDFLATTRAPVTLDVQMATIEEGTKSIASAAQGLLKNLNPDQALAFLRKANTSYAAEMLALGTRETAIDKDEWDIRAKNTADYYTSAASEVGDFYTFQKQQSKDAAAVLKKDLSTQKTDIETAFNKGLDVTDTQMLQTAAGTYSDVALESARQLDDIAQHGREALSRHKDWIAKFNIPAPLMDTNQDAEKQLKAWAADQRDMVKNLTHPNEVKLIDWDAFVKSYQQGLDESATKLVVEDYAFNKLMEAGLIGPGGEEAAKKKIEGMFGTPKVTMESYFGAAKTDDPTMQKFLNVMAGGKSVQIPAEFTFSGQEMPQPPATVPSPQPKGRKPSDYFNPETGQYQEEPYTPSSKQASRPLSIADKTPDVVKSVDAQTTTQHADMLSLMGVIDGAFINGPTAPGWTSPFGPPKGTLTGATGGMIEPIDLSKALPPTATPDMTAMGTTMWGSLSAGMIDAAKSGTLAKDMSNAIFQVFIAGQKSFQASGDYVGVQILAGVVEACQTGGQDIITAIANSVAPSVAKILNRNGPQRSLDNSCW